jgi:hypothetical protein
MEYNKHYTGNPYRDASRGGNVGAGTSAPAGNVGAGSSAPEPPPPGPIVSDDRDAEGNIGVGTTH